MKEKDLSLQVLAVTMHREDLSLADKMHIEGDALIGNQCDRTAKETVKTESGEITMYSFAERGVGLNRNNLLLRADADIVLFADDDVIYDEGYRELVLREFRKHPRADVITFNVVPIPDTIPPDLNTKWKRLGRLNCLKYGAPRIAARLSRLREKNLYFSLLFGGGAKYSSGEDSLFIMDCVKSGLKVYAAPVKIGHVVFETSSWFSGYTEKYFKDKGLFFYYLSHRFYKLLCLQYCIRRGNLFRELFTRREAYRLMKTGSRIVAMSFCEPRSCKSLLSS